MNTRHLILLALLLAQCTHPGKRIPAPEDLYTEDGLTVISTYFNPTAQTTTILFGNAPALQSARHGYATHTPGEDYRLVTWHQHPNPLWFGGHINTSIKTIEQVTTTASNNHISFTYNTLRGQTTGLSQEQRIAHLFSLPRLVFP